MKHSMRAFALRARLALLLLVCSAVLACSFASEVADGQAPRGVGYTELKFVDHQRPRILETTLWYPAEENSDPTEEVYPSFFLGYAKRDAAVLPGSERRPLILISHGDRGTSTNLAWLAERLADQGYLVAGVDHWLNTTRNNEPEETLRIWNRPADISFVLDQLLADPIWGKRIESESRAIHPGGTPPSHWQARSLIPRRWRRTASPNAPGRIVDWQKMPILPRWTIPGHPIPIATSELARLSRWRPRSVPESR